MELIYGMLVFVSASLSAAAVISIVRRNEEIKKLKGGAVLTGIKEKTAGAISSLKAHINGVNKKLTGTARYGSIALLLKRVDMDSGDYLEDFLLGEESCAAAGAAAGAILLSNVFAGAACAAALFFVPEAILRAKAARKREGILREMPDAYDIIAASIEGGLSASMALVRYASRAKGVFAAELFKTVKKIELGEGFETALKAMAAKNGIAELGGFVNAFVQAEKTGGNVREAIRSQAAEIRQKRFMALKKKAYEAPVKLLIPLILFIFPVIFIILFGPIMIKLMNGL
jgi:tight adherence protein C